MTQTQSESDDESCSVVTSTAVTTTAKGVAPEDIRAGCWITVMRASCEFPSFFWNADTSALPPERPVRFPYIPCTSGVPMKVRSVCVPFVLAESPDGELVTLDLRRCDVAEISAEFAKAAKKPFGANADSAMKKRRKNRRRE